MSQITTGIRSILGHPLVYNLWQWSLGATQGRKIYVKKYLRPSPSDTILDIGCGTAAILDYLPLSVNYFGFDLDQNYIEHAKKKYGNRGQFICNDVNNLLADLPQFDLILANGVLHHLNDSEAIQLFKMAASCLKKEGRMLTIDGCYLEKQTKLARFFISQDRGCNIRFPEGYQSLAKPAFIELRTEIKHDLLRIPYTHFIMECRKPI